MVCSVGLASEDACKKYVTEADIAFADQYFDLIAVGDFELALQRLEPQLRPRLVAQKDVLRNAFNEVKGFQRSLIGCSSYEHLGGDTRSKAVNIAYQWNSSDKWYAGNISWKEVDGSKTVNAINISLLPASLEQTNAFNLFQKGVLHWIFLFLGASALCLSVVALVVCIRTKIPKRKWLWILFIVAGVGQLTLNWTTGDMHLNVFASQFFGVGVFRPNAYAAWMVTISLPLGAIVFLMRRKKLADFKVQELPDVQNDKTKGSF